MSNTYNYEQKETVDVTIQQLDFQPFDTYKMSVSVPVEIDYYEENNLPPEVSFKFGVFSINDVEINKFFETVANDALEKEPEAELSDFPLYLNEDEREDLIDELSELIKTKIKNTGFIEIMDKGSFFIETVDDKINSLF